MRFETASIHSHRFAGDAPSDRRVLPGGRWVVTNTSARTLLRIALGTDRVAGAPGWVDSETFDISATTADHAEIKTPEHLAQAALSLLEDRFQLKFHREQKEGPVYWLELDKGDKPGPGLRPSAADATANMSTNSDGPRIVMKATKATTADMAAVLRRQSGRPVEDHTGLRGNFDFEMQWARDETPDSTVPALFTALREQLGLKLRSAKGMVETVVIDQIARPSDN